MKLVLPSNQSVVGWLREVKYTTMYTPPEPIYDGFRQALHEHAEAVEASWEIEQTSDKKKPKKHKHNAKIVVIDGYKFSSEAEAKQYVRLKDDSDVYDLEPQPKPDYVLQESFRDSDGKTLHHAIKYRPDFRFKRHSQPDLVFIVEVKGQLLPDAAIKIKLFRKQYPTLVFQMVTAGGQDWYEAQKERRARKRAKQKAGQKVS